jgi:hypothetical protein
MRLCLRIRHDNDVAKLIRWKNAGADAAHDW